jgi:hypothetical protein
MSTRCQLVLAGISVLATLSAPVSAQAQPTTNQAARDEARRLLRAGTAAYERRDYTTALADFQAALAAFPSARIQYNIGQTLRELHRPVDAAVAFEAFLKESDRVTAQQRGEAQAALQDLEPQVARVTVLTNVSGVDVAIDGIARGQTPLSDPIIVAPGRHDIALARSGYSPVHETITVAGGEQRKATFTLDRPSPPPASVAVVPPPEAATVPPAVIPPSAPPNAAPAPEPAPGPTVPFGPPTPAPSHARNIIAGSLLATSAVVAIVGAAMLGASWQRYNEAVDNGCSRNCPTAADEVESRARWSKILFGAAAVSGVGAATVFLAYPTESGPRESAGTTGGLVLVGSGRF